MSKGSNPRPFSVSQEAFSQAWDVIFNPVVCPECNSVNWKHAHGHSACGMEADYKLCEDCDHQWDIG
jgi:transposase-like protein